MSDDNNLKYFLENPSYSGSVNAGTYQANNNQPLAQRQSYESDASYQQRAAAYDYAKNNNG